MPWFIKVRWRRLVHRLYFSVWHNRTGDRYEDYMNSAKFISKWYPWLRGHLFVMGEAKGYSDYQVGKFKAKLKG